MAAAMAAGAGLSPRDLSRHIKQLQQALLNDDCYLPGVIQEMPPLTRRARLIAAQGDPEPVRDGVGRPVGGDLHAWIAEPGQSAAYLFGEPVPVEEVTLLLDSALDALIALSHHQPDDQLGSVPPVMPKSFRIRGLRAGRWRTLVSVDDNHQRLVRLPVRSRVEGIRFALDSTWGSEQARVYGFYVR
jgi:hypothetical protein